MRRISGKNFDSSLWSNTSASDSTRNGSCPCSGFAGLNSGICGFPSLWIIKGSSATSGLPFQLLPLVLR